CPGRSCALERPLPSSADEQPEDSPLSTPGVGAWRDSCVAERRCAELVQRERRSNAGNRLPHLLPVRSDAFTSPTDTRKNALTTGTAAALAVLAVTPAFAHDAGSGSARTAPEEMMTSAEKATVESLQNEIAMLQKTVEQIRKASSERALVQAKQQAEADSHPFWP